MPPPHPRASDPSAGLASSGATAPHAGALLIAVLVAFSAQQVLLPALAPFARESGLSEIQLGSVMGVAAAFLVVAAPVWARRCAALGPRAVLVTSLGIALTGLAAFGLVATAALDGRLGPTATFLLMLATRGVIFGIGLSGVPVAAMAFVVTTTTATTRSAGLSRLGAAQGAAIVVGPAVGAAVALAGLLGPVWAAPVVLALALTLVLVGVPPANADFRPATPTRVRPWDPRVRSWLLIGFLLYTGLSLVLLTLGFGMQDRGGLGAEAAARATGAVTFACGLVLAGIQGGLIPRLDWAPRQMLIVGVPVAALGLAGLALASGAWTIALAMLVVSVGMAIASPGYIAGPTLGVHDHEQSAVAGLVTATNGLAFVAGPALGGALYAAAYPLPFLTAAVVTILGLVVVLADKAGAAAAGRTA